MRRAKPIPGAISGGHVSTMRVVMRAAVLLMAVLLLSGAQQCSSGTNNPTPNQGSQDKTPSAEPKKEEKKKEEKKAQGNGPPTQEEAKQAIERHFIEQKQNSRAVVTPDQTYSVDIGPIEIGSSPTDKVGQGEVPAYPVRAPVTVTQFNAGKATTTWQLGTSGNPPKQFSFFRRPGSNEWDFSEAASTNR